MEVIDTPNFQHDVNMFGFRVGEPVITLTSLLITLVCGYCWWRLRKQPASDAIRLTRLFFLFMGMSTLVGGLVGHAFLYLLPFAFKIPGWVLGMVAASALAQASIVRSEDILKPRTKRFFTFLNIGGFAVLLVWVLTTLRFPIVEAHSAFCLLLIVTSLEVYRWRKLKDQSSAYILSGILLAVAAVLVHILKWSLGVWFTFFDIGHVFLCGTMLLILKAAECERSEPS